MNNSFSNDLKYSRPNRIKAGNHQEELRKKINTTQDLDSTKEEFRTHAFIWVCLILIFSVQSVISSGNSEQTRIPTATIALEELLPESPPIQIVQSYPKKTEKQKPSPNDYEKSWKAFQENRVLYKKFLESGSI